ncbi:hypothetical protein N7474_000736 [Penicillium riverlandense]|uniref:uncharacterized protein n=1 Tax=Penicillium riverlandense TaxID=1903569 RepID=UPI0025490FE6|nr:uncharacterized protein N7474_000736 [Penicillium riverlandense]KAJ5832425.1 hypothetical protein N7474_000736 [Penicillium riverlandense]
MSFSQSLRRNQGTPLFHLRNFSPRDLHRVNLPAQRTLRNAYSIAHSTRRTNGTQKPTQSSASLHSTRSSPRSQIHAASQPALASTVRTFSLNATSGKSPADLLVEELQELYEVAKDEFEIATDSTEAGTIYAASDRESARDALRQLTAVYNLYTTGDTQEHVTDGQANAEGGGEGGPPIETMHDPAEVSQAVRDEVKKRVAQRVRELVNAVEVLEEKAKAD